MQKQRPAKSSDDTNRRVGGPVALLAALALAVGVTACGGNDGGDGSDNGSNAIVTGSAKCDQASMQKAVESWSKSYGGGESATLPDGSGNYRCSEGWAVAFPDVGPTDMAVTVTAVFEAEGQFWIPKDRGQVCGKSASDSEVPASLYRDACQTN